MASVCREFQRKLNGWMYALDFATISSSGRVNDSDDNESGRNGKSKRTQRNQSRKNAANEEDEEGGEGEAEAGLESSVRWLEGKDKFNIKPNLTIHLAFDPPSMPQYKNIVSRAQHRSEEGGSGGVGRDGKRSLRRVKENVQALIELLPSFDPLERFSKELIAKFGHLGLFLRRKLDASSGNKEEEEEEEDDNSGKREEEIQVIWNPTIQTERRKVAMKEIRRRRIVQGGEEEEEQEDDDDGERTVLDMDELLSEIRLLGGPLVDDITVY
jgi:hypothetical protein